MPPQVTFEYNPLSYAYPDDESEKEVFLQASRRDPAPLLVLLYWVNTVFPDGDEVWQVVRLDYREDDGVHRYVYPDMIVVDGCERDSHATHSLGVLTRDQRETVLECAEDVGYEPKSAEEGQGLKWMRALLERMVEEGVVRREVVDAIGDAVPLP